MKSDATASSEGPPANVQERGKRRALRLGIALGALVAVVGVTWLVSRAWLPPELAVVEVRREDVSQVLAVTGNVEAQRRVGIAPEAPGRITEILRFEGERVRAGEVLARMVDPEARAVLDQRQAALAAQRDQRAQAQRDLQRTLALAADGAVSKDELEQARLRAAQGDQEEARLAAAVRAELSQLVLVAPFDGTLVRRDGEVGQVAGSDRPVFELATMSDLYVTAEVDERYVSSLRRGMKAEIMPVSLRGQPRSATISYLARAVDPQTGASTVRFRYAQSPEDVLVGGAVDVNIRVEEVKGALVVPRDCVVGSHRDTHVLVVEAETVVRRKVEIRDWPAAWVVVTHGLSKGELVVRDPGAAQAGSKVRPKVAKHV
jgi:RND family efflux transporter MFP subunit